MDIATLFLQAQALHQSGQLEAAKAHYQQILTLDPKHIGATHYLGVVFLMQNDLAHALPLIEQTAQSHPQEPGFLCNYGVILKTLGRYEEAEIIYKQAIDDNPNNVDVHFNLGELYNIQYLYPQAEAAYRQALTLNPRYIKAHINLAVVLYDQKQPDQALTQLEHAATLQPDMAKIYSNMATIYLAQGKYQNAIDTLKKAIQYSADDGFNYFLLSRIKQYTFKEKEIHHMEILLKDSPSPANSIYCAFALATAYEKKKHYPKAFRYMQLGNQLKRKNMQYNPNELIDATMRIQRVFSNSSLFLKNTAPHPKIVFIVGMPRSGSTLLEQILLMGPNVKSIGERSIVIPITQAFSKSHSGQLGYPEMCSILHADALHSLAHAYCQHASIDPAQHQGMIIDKTLGNFLHVGLLRQLFPDAKFIHMHRDPRDVFISCYRLLFKRSVSFSYDPKEFVNVYQHYVKMMRFWEARYPDAIFSVSYEDVVQDFETQIQPLLQFVGLPWGKQYEKFYESKKIVYTASYTQVKSPLYQTSIGAWKKFEPFMPEIFSALDPRHNLNKF